MCRKYVAHMSIGERSDAETIAWIQLKIFKLIARS